MKKERWKAIMDGDLDHEIVTNYYDLEELKWAKALVAAFAMASSRTVRRESCNVYLTPRGWYVVRVRAPRGHIRAVWSGFVQAYITTGGGYGQMHHRIPRGSKRVWPPRPPKRRKR